VLRSATVGRIQAKLASKPRHVVHVIAHGVAGKILLVGEDTKSMSALDDVAFAQLFAGRAVRLVLLGVCQSAANAAGAPLRGVGPALIAQRVPAVVAMQYPSVLLDTAAAFAGGFYDALAGSLPVDVAVSEARQRLAALMDLGARDWSTPVLFVGTREASIVEIAAEPMAVAPITAAETGDAIARGVERLRRLRRIELPLLELDKKVRELVAEAKRADDEEKLSAMDGMVTDCLTLNDSMKSAITTLDAAGAGPPTGGDRNPAEAIAGLLGQIDAALRVAPPIDVRKPCGDLLRLVKRATVAWREDIDEQLDGLGKLVLSLRFA